MKYVVRTLPLTPAKGGPKSDFVVFANKIQVQSNTFCYKVSFFVRKLTAVKS